MTDEARASKHGSELARLGASKGGAARALALSPEDRTQIARMAAEKRWGAQGKTGGLPRATHVGPLHVGNIEFECAVLANGKRVVAEQEFMSAMGMYRSGALSTRRKEDPDGGAPIPLFLAHKNLKPFAEKHLGGVHFEPLKYRTPGGNVAHGIEASVIPKICEVWIDADRAGVLGPRQKVTAAKADVLLRALAHVGIIALVDEATGYQAERARDELQQILEAYISPELLPWTRRFPDEFFKQIYRLQGWEYKPGSVARPQYVGKLVNQLVYEPMPTGILDKLKQVNPPNEKGYRRYKHHRFLTEDIGNPHLNKQIIEVTTLMRVSEDKASFEQLFRKAFPKRGQQLPLALGGDEKNEE